MKYRILIAILVLCSVFVPGIGVSTARAQATCPTNPQDSDDWEDFLDWLDDMSGDDPISMATGAFSFSVTDLKEPGVMPIVFTRQYVSTIGYAGPIGNNWDFSFNRYLSFASGVTYYHTGQGYKVPIAYNGSGSTPVQSSTRDYYVLSINSSNQFVVTDRRGTQDIFDSNGNLLETLDRNGNELVYTRDTNGNLLSIQDPVHGQALTITLDSHYHISSITDSAGRTVSYTYDSNYNLTGVTSPPTSDFPSGITRNYGYDSDQRMTSETDGNGNTFLSNTYGTIGTAEEFKVVSQTFNGHTATIVYDDTHNHVTSTDFNGFVTEYYNDGNGNITKRIVHTAGLHSGEPSTYETDYTYDSSFNKIQESDPNGNTMSWTYDGHNNVLTATKSAPAGSTINSSMGTQSLTSAVIYTYEPRFNQVASITDPNGNETTYDYGNATSNPGGNLLSITYPTTAAGTGTETFTYNDLGQALTDTAPDGTVTKNSYDGSTGYLTETITDYGSGKLNATAQYTYDSYGHVASIEDPNGNTTNYTTNELDQVTEIDGASGEVETFSYDGDKKLIVDKKQASGSTWEETDTVYNSYEQAVGVKKFTGTSTYLETTYTYDGNGNRITVTDPLNHTVTVAYDERNKLYLKTDALNNTVKYDFDGNGNTVKLTDELGHVTTYAYDGLDRCEQKTFPDSSDQTWIYDAAGNITSLLTTAGNTITQTYDTRNRMLTQNYGSTITNTYDIMERLLTSAERGASLTYVYDDLGRNTSFTDQAGHESTYTYDLIGNRTSSTYPTSVTVNRAYDSANRLSTLKDGSGSTMVTYSYDILDRVTGISLANGTTVTPSADLLNRITSIDNTLNSGNRNYSYVYDDASRITSTTEPRGTISSGYSDRNEVTGIEEPGGSPFPDQGFAYDAGFNRSSWTLGSTTTNYTVNNLNQYSTVSGSTAPTWNSDGSLASFAGNTYIYDALMRLTEADYFSGKTLFSYDPMGRRVKKINENTSGTVLSTYQYHYDGTEVAVEYRPEATWTYYLGIDVDDLLLRVSGTTKQWYYRDVLGSICAVADNSGNLLEAYEYTAQGEFQITNSSGSVLAYTGIGNDVLFTGRNYDPETGNYFYRARYYNPVLGRFISRDPLSGAEFSQGTNLYGYVGNNFINVIDPNGQEWQVVVVIIVCIALVVEGIPGAGEAPTQTVNPNNGHNEPEQDPNDPPPATDPPAPNSSPPSPPPPPDPPSNNPSGPTPNNNPSGPTPNNNPSGPPAEPPAPPAEPTEPADPPAEEACS